MSFFSNLATELELDNVGSEFAHLYTDAEIARIAERALAQEYQRKQKQEAETLAHRMLRRLIHDEY